MKFNQQGQSIGAPLILFLIFINFSCQQDHYETIKKEPFLLGKSYGLSEIKVHVNNMDSVRVYFSDKLGFSLGRSPGPEKGVVKGTLESAIRFPGLVALNLVTINDTVPVSGQDSLFLESLKKQYGPRDYMLSSSSVDSTRAWLSSQGFALDSIKTYQILNDSPRKEAWDSDYAEMFHLKFTSDELNSIFPGFQQFSNFPYDRMNEFNSYYNMQRGFIKHPNGAVGIKAIKIHLEDIEVARQDFLKMGFVEVNGVQNKNEAHFKLRDNQEIRIVSNKRDQDSLTSTSMKTASGIYSMVVEVADIKATKEFLGEKLSKNDFTWDSVSKQLIVPKENAFGLQLEFVQEPAEQALAVSQVSLNYGTKLDSVARHNANKIYQQYCALCHGQNREGYAADHAPSLRSKSLLASAKGSNYLRYAIQYGRGESAMAGYSNQLGGPLSYIEIELLLKWLEEEAGVEEPVELTRDPVEGDVVNGKGVYQINCAECHGDKGEGINAPALGNPMLLATATDDFLRYAITEGRDGTPMVAYKDILSEQEIDDVTAFLRSRASGWDVPKRDSIVVPSPENYILNPDGKNPDFKLKENRYVSAKQLNQALLDSTRIVILDARSKVAWRQTHIPGALPVPYYEDPEEFLKHIPKENTMIVAYCACPHAASGRVIDKLNNLGYKNTAILDEGILIWAQLGYPVSHGQ